MAVSTQVSESSFLQGDRAVSLWRETAQSLGVTAAFCDRNWVILATAGNLGSIVPNAIIGESLADALRPLADPFLAGRLEAALDATDKSLLAQIGLAQYRLTVSTFDAAPAWIQVDFRPANYASPDLLTPVLGLGVPDLLSITQEPVIAWRLDDQTIEYWSAAAQTLYGYSLEAVAGKPHHTLIAPESAGIFQRGLADLMLNRTWSGRLIYRSQNGLVKHVEAAMVVVNSDHGLVVWQTNRDVTTRHHTEQALEFHFAMNQSITNQAVDPIFVVGGSGDILFSNPEASRIFGWAQEELVGRSLHETLHHHTPDLNAFPSDLCPLLEAQRSGKVLRGLELVFFRRDGSPVPVSCSNSPMAFQGGEMGAIVIIRDISQLKTVEAALAESKERLRLAVDSSQIGIWDLHLGTRRLTLDENSRQALGLVADRSLSAANWLRMLHPDDRKEVKANIERALKPGGSERFAVECRTLGGPGQRTRFISIRGQALVEENNGIRVPVRLVGTIQDVSNAKRVEVALRQANQDLQEFAYAAAHDLQEPLRNLMNLHGLHRRQLRQPGEPNEEMRQGLLEAGAREAQRMHDMVRDLLLFSEAGQQIEPVRELVAADAILSQTLSALHPEISVANAYVRSDRLPMVRMRPAHLSQLLLHLVGNAIKYRHPERRLSVQVTAKRRGADWLFSVADNGIGFESVYARRIFGVFKRLHGQAEYPGSGIGLAICARIVALYGGRIWADGVAGLGATFYFTIPVVSE